jgi:hypothetical protein
MISLKQHLWKPREPIPLTWTGHIRTRSRGYRSFKASEPQVIIVAELRGRKRASLLAAGAAHLAVAPAFADWAIALIKTSKKIADTDECDRVHS